MIHHSQFAQKNGGLTSFEKGKDLKQIFSDHFPIYLQVVERIKTQIITGAVKPGEKLCAVRELANQFGINPNTVQKACQWLEQEGIIISERGSGNYITDDPGIIGAIRSELSGGVTGEYIRKMKEYGFASPEIVRILTDGIKEIENGKNNTDESLRQ